MEYYAVNKHGHVTAYVMLGLFCLKCYILKLDKSQSLLLVTLEIKKKYLQWPHSQATWEWNGFPFFFFSFNLVCSGLHPSVSSHYRVLWSCISSSVASIFSVQLPSDSKGGDPNMSCRRVISGQAAHPSGRTPCRPFFGSGPWLCTQLLCRLDKYSVPRNLLFDTWLSFHISMYFICYM